jgi:uncharacterized FAD-dependent dehydrogenase
MAIYVKNLIAPLEADDEELIDKAVRRAGISRGELTGASVVRRSLDFRRTQPRLVCSVALTCTWEAEQKAAAPGHPDKSRPVVVGLGPAGLFAALLLARYGYRPLVLERGADLERRAAAVERFFREGVLDPDSNIQFGEGGAGAFSDGKLTTRIHDFRCDYVMERLLEAGAPPETALRPKPHLGTDLLRGVVLSLRKQIEALGGEVRFLTPMTGIRTQNAAVFSVLTGMGEQEAQAVILACGHSARDCFEMAARAGVQMEAKPFSVGARIEHLQENIDRALYGRYAGHPALPPGEYQLSWREGDRAAYTFCMCPGGYVVAAASEPGGIATNGMSYHARDGKNANSALVVSVDRRDFGSDWRDAVAFQRRLEEGAYRLTQSYRAPAQSVGRFLEARGGIAAGTIAPTYAPGVQEADLAGFLPPQVVQMMRLALPRFGRRLKGFDSPTALFTGVESRTSSPVRLMRDADTLCAVGLDGLYPCGEGAGYAGGIMSAAVDGVRAAQALMARYAPPQGI